MKKNATPTLKQQFNEQPFTKAVQYIKLLAEKSSRKSGNHASPGPYFSLSAETS
jgi:hypothetical protein